MPLDMQRVVDAGSAELNEVTALDIDIADPLSLPILEAVRDAVLAANAAGKFDDTGPFSWDIAFHDIVMQLVPEDRRDRHFQFWRIISAAEIDIDRFVWTVAFGLEFGDWGTRRNADLGDLEDQTPNVQYGRALYLAYLTALSNVAAWVEASPGPAQCATSSGG